VIVSLLLVRPAALLAGAVLGRHCRRLQRRLRERAGPGLQDSEAQARARLDGLQQQLEQLQAELDSAQQHGQRQLQALASEQQLRLGHQAPARPGAPADRQPVRHAGGLDRRAAPGRQDL
jgi:TolA-binding protein